MFRRASSQPQTGLHALTHVAWGTSVGGLVLLAEERRRRVALAQKIIENGKKLQGYKSYGAVAAIAEFDLSGDWHPTSQHDYEEHRSEESSNRSLTNHEWRSRRRSHRSLPTTSPNVTGQDSHISRHAETFHPKDDAVKKDPPSRTGISNSSIYHRLQVPAKDTSLPAQAQSPNALSATSPHPVSPSPRKLIPSYTKERSFTYQNIIATRVIECLESDDTKFRVAGFHELSVFFKRRHHDLSTGMQKAIRLAWRSSKTELHTHLGTDIRRRVLASVADSTNSSQDLDAQSTVAAGKESQSSVCERITRQVHVNQLESAYFDFLSLCETVAEPLEHFARKSISRLLSAFKAEGLHSVVTDIYQRTLVSLKDWQALRKKQDIQWVLQEGTAASTLGFCQSVFEALVRMSEPDGINMFSTTVLDWSFGTASISDTIALYGIIGDLELGRKNQKILRDMADSLTQRAFREGSLDDAATLLIWRGNRDTGSLCTDRQLEVVLRHLISTNKLGPAAEILVSAQVKHDWKLGFSRLFDTHHATTSFYDHLIEALQERKGLSAIARLETDIAPAHRLSGQSLLYLYKAFAEHGRIVEAEEALQRFSIRGTDFSDEAVQASSTALIRRCWKSTRNLDVTERLFKQILTLCPSTAVTHHTQDQFNAVIKACVEAGDLEKAETYTTQMIHEYNLAITPFSMANFMLAKAVEGDWMQVEKLLQDLQAHAQNSGRPTEVEAGIFDSVYNRYCEQHTVAESIAFVTRILGLFDLRPSGSMCRRTTDLLITAEDIQGLEDWCRFTSQHERLPELSSEAISQLMHRIAPNNSLKFREALQTEEVLANVLKNVDNPSDFATHLEEIYDEEEEKLQTRRLREPLQTTGQQEDFRSRAQQNILRSLAQHDYDGAIRAYWTSSTDGLPAQPINLTLAVKAMLMSDEYTAADIQQLIQSAQDAGLDVGRTEEVLFLQSLVENRLTEAEAHDVVFSHYRTQDESHRKVAHYVTLAVTRNLFLQGANDAARKLLRDVQRSQWGRSKPFKISEMTLMLRILIKMGDFRGVLDAVKAVMEHNLRIDWTFIRALTAGRQLYGRKAIQHGGPDMDEEARGAFYDMLNLCAADAKKRRHEQRCRTLTFAKEVVDMLARVRVEPTEPVTVENAGVSTQKD
jgi:pentatricopeptide repeat protein